MRSEHRFTVLLVVFQLVLAVGVGHAQTIADAQNARVGPDGYIYASAFYTAPAGSPVLSNVRLNGNGTLDLTFTPDSANPASSIGFLNNGTLVVAGGTGVDLHSTSDWSITSNVSFFAGDRALVINSSGTSFYTGLGKYSDDGQQQVSFGSAWTYGSTSAIALEANGSTLIAAGQHLVRIDSGGAADLSFFTNASAAIGNSGSILGLAVQSDNKIVVSGSDLNGSSKLIRLLSTGAIDPSFSATLSSYGPVNILGDGTILVSSGVNGTDISFDSADRAIAVGALIRLNANGSLYPLQPVVDGTFDGSSGVSAYTLTSIPEPSTYAALAGVFALGLAFIRRRRA